MGLRSWYWITGSFYSSRRILVFRETGPDTRYGIFNYFLTNPIFIPDGRIKVLPKCDVVTIPKQFQVCCRHVGYEAEVSGGALIHRPVLLYTKATCYKTMPYCYDAFNSYPIGHLPTRARYGCPLSPSMSHTVCSKIVFAIVLLSILVIKYAAHEGRLLCCQEVQMYIEHMMLLKCNKAVSVILHALRNDVHLRFRVPLLTITKKTFITNWQPSCCCACFQNTGCDWGHTV